MYPTGRHWPSSQQKAARAALASPAMSDPRNHIRQASRGSTVGPLAARALVLAVAWREGTEPSPPLLDSPATPTPQGGACERIEGWWDGFVKPP